MNSTTHTGDEKEDMTLSLVFEWIPKTKSSLDRRFEACAQLARKMHPSLYEVDR